MGILDKIFDTLGLGKAKAAPPPPAAKPAAAPVAAKPAAPPPPKPTSIVDVVGQLEARAKASKQKLNWRTSIVDLLKLLEIDSSLAARKELAKELGAPADLMGDSAKMNVWLHGQVINQIALNGGNVPKSMLD